MSSEITITDSNTSIIVEFAPPNRMQKLTLNKNVLDFVYRRGDDVIEAILGTSGFGRYNSIYIDWNKVVSPSTASVEDLLTILIAYKEMNAYRSGLYSFSAGSYPATITIPFTTPMADTNYTIVWDDVDGVGFNAPSNLTVNGFDITLVLGAGKISYHAIAN